LKEIAGGLLKIEATGAGRFALDRVSITRRALLQAITAALTAAGTSFDWADVVEAADHVHSSVQGRADTKLSMLTAAEAADVEAVSAQIVPTDDTPGAREAGVVFFIDLALASYFPQMAAEYRAQLAAFQAAFRKKHPAAGSFASLTSDRQIEYLTEVEHTRFFATTRVFTLLGMFTHPSYGGNRNGVGWKLLGFEDAHVFQPPFGYYDRHYPGFVVDPGRGK
jgi:gluconate 2-dehydrogenase gamma chain